MVDSKSKGKRISIFNTDLLVYIFYLFIFLFFLAMGIALYIFGTHLNFAYSPLSIVFVLNVIFVFTVIMRDSFTVKKLESKGLYKRKLLVGLLLGVLLTVLQGGLTLVGLYQLLVFTIIFDRVSFLLTSPLDISTLFSVLLIISTVTLISLMIGLSATGVFLLGSIGVFYLYALEIKSLLLR